MSLFLSPQNAVYFIMLTCLVHKLFTFYIKGAIKFKCSAAGPAGSKCKFLPESACAEVTKTSQLMPRKRKIAVYLKTDKNVT
jgi:hypothetical protein